MKPIVSAVFTHERLGRLLAGGSVLVTATMGYFHHPLWLLLTAGTALNLVLSGITDRCAVKNLLIWMGLPGERDVGRAEALLADAARKPVAFQRKVRRQRVSVN